MSRAIAIMLACALTHVGPPVAYLTLAVAAPAAANALFVYAVAWTFALLGYDMARMRHHD